jgi:microcin C transport system ATP-binding protein
MTAIIDVRDLNVAFALPGTAQRVAAVRGVSFTINRGETVAIVGESGSGKSVTALALLRLLPPTASVTGSVQVLGTDVASAPEEALRQLRGNRVGVIFQEPMTALNPLHTVERQIGEMLWLHRGITGEAARARVIELLTLVGIDRPELRLGAFAHQLSGGQRQRVMIAMALANDPDVLIADEPTTALDVTVQAQILDLLRDLQARLGMALVLISHDLGIVRRVAARVLVMRHGEIVESGPTEALFQHPSHPYTTELLSAEPEGTPAPVDAAAPVVLSASDLKVWFPIKRGVLKRTVDHIKAVDGVDFVLRAGETLGVVGESGSGKTTLGLALLRLTGSKGEIRFQDQDLQRVRGRPLRALRRHVQIVFQDPYGALSPRWSVAEIIGEGLGVHEPDLSQADTDARVIAALRDVGLDPAARHRYPHEFSGGQRQRIAIARALILRPRVVVLDEPTSALDRTVQKQIVELLRDLQARFGLAYVFISHDLAVVRAMSHSVIVMRGGKVVEAAETRQLFSHPEADYTKRLIEAAFLKPPQ